MEYMCNDVMQKKDKKYRGVLDALASLGSMLESESVINVFETLSYLGYIFSLFWAYLGHILGYLGAFWGYVSF